VDAVEFAAYLRPGLARLFSATRQEAGEPAQKDVSADPLFEPVVDRTQVKDGFHVPPAALGFEELLVTDGGVLGG
jgi:hypothetical protein